MSLPQAARTKRHKQKHSEHYREYARAHSKQYRANNRDKVAASHRRWARENPDRVAWNSLKRQARIGGYKPIIVTLEEFSAWYWHHIEKCEGRCEWCRAKFTVREPHIDHDHETGIPRALVCKWCNFIEGHARSPAHLLLIVKAMRRFR